MKEEVTKMIEQAMKSYERDVNERICKVSGEVDNLLGRVSNLEQKNTNGQESGEPDTELIC